ncbi:DUF5011 domain-containing protein [Sesbania bispinosa]|nr:DUF5011 domain-containing protein [Sesbania bispinosa]
MRTQCKTALLNQNFESSETSQQYSSNVENSQSTAEDGGLKRAGTERDKAEESGEGREKMTVMRKDETGHDARWETGTEMDGAR